MNDSVSEMINKKIDDIINEKNIYYSGQVIRINNFIVEARGLSDAFYFEKVFINNENNIGYVDKIEANKVIISLIKTDGNIKIGDSVITTGKILEMSFSEDSIGMIIDPFGLDRITGKKLNNCFDIPVETEKIGIMERTAVKRPLETGIAAIDLMFPIGRGQRQLIIGDKKTGKTQICLDTIVNQKDKNVICIYVAIGKNKKELKNLYAKLVNKGAHEYSIIVSVFNDDLPPLIKLTPYIALSIAEYYMKKGKDVLVCIDDLKKHAEACREIALLSEKNTGRDAYPADIFYTHSRLLEKGCQHKNGGSITILPIVETKGSDITDYISTNIISITDGQIVLSEKMFKKGQKPAINFGLSVSRLGSDVQNELIKKIGSSVRRELLTYLETADVYQLVNIESMSKELQEQLLRGSKILSLLKQPKYSPISAQELKNRFEFINDKSGNKELKDNSTNNEVSNTNINISNEPENNNITNNELSNTDIDISNEPEKTDITANNEVSNTDIDISNEPEKTDITTNNEVSNTNIDISNEPEKNVITANNELDDTNIIPVKNIKNVKEESNKVDNENIVELDNTNIIPIKSKKNVKEETDNVDNEKVEELEIDDNIEDIEELEIDDNTEIIPIIKKRG